VPLQFTHGKRYQIPYKHHNQYDKNIADKIRDVENIHTVTDAALHIQAGDKTNKGESEESTCGLSPADWTSRFFSGNGREKALSYSSEWIYEGTA
jgi:hypothetical protein